MLKPELLDTDVYLVFNCCFRRASRRISLVQLLNKREGARRGGLTEKERR